MLGAATQPLTCRRDDFPIPGKMDVNRLVGLWPGQIRSSQTRWVRSPTCRQKCCGGSRPATDWEILEAVGNSPAILGVDCY